MNPIDIIANAIRLADGNHTMGTGNLAEVAANALDDERIVAVAAEAIVDHPALDAADHPHVRAMDLARAVLRSVGNAR